MCPKISCVIFYLSSSSSSSKLSASSAAMCVNPSWIPILFFALVLNYLRPFLFAKSLSCTWKGLSANYLTIGDLDLVDLLEVALSVLRLRSGASCLFWKSTFVMLSIANSLTMGIHVFSKLSKLDIFCESNTRMIACATLS